MKKLFAVLATAITAYIGLAFVAGTPADATGCTTNNYTTTDNVSTHNDADATNASVRLLPKGVKVSTPDDKAYEVAKFDGHHSSLDEITAMLYETYKYPASTGGDAVVAYKLEVDLYGTTGFSTLVYEPYQNDTVQTDTWQTWHPLQGKWWSTAGFPELGIPKNDHTPEPWSTIKSTYHDAVVLNYQASQGTGNAGAISAFDALTFSGKNGCETQTWGLPIKATSMPTTTPSTHPAVTPTHGAASGTHQGAVGGGGGTGGNTHPLLTTPDAGLSPTTASPSPSSSQEAAALPTDGPSDSLAPLAPTVAATPAFQKTGHAMAWTGGVVLGLLLVVGAMVLLRQGRQRKRTQAQHAASSQTTTYQQGRVGVDSDPTQTTELPPYQE